jgi:hypothetical protein
LAATLAAYAGLALAAAVFFREHYLTPLVTHSTNLPGSAWIINNWYTKDGKLVSQSAIRNILQGHHLASATRVGPNTSQTILNPVGYLTKHGYIHWTSYQPASRFWPFQWIEGGELAAGGAARHKHHRRVGAVVAGKLPRPGDHLLDINQVIRECHGRAQPVVRADAHPTLAGEPVQNPVRQASAFWLRGTRRKVPGLDAILRQLLCSPRDYPGALPRVVTAALCCRSGR